MRKLRILTALLLLSSVVMAQSRQLTGTVTDSKSGSGLPAATIGVKGKTAKTAAGPDGSFSLTVPAGNISLEVTSVGYVTKTILVEGDKSNITVALDQASADMSEVVVTALGISKQTRKVGYAVSTVGGDQMSKARENNVALGLAGQVAGLNVHGTNGGPGGSARILLRGISSITGGGAPLFVINGVPMDNSQRGSAGEWGGSDNGDGIGNINPDDIESMTVLKGLAASALYGSRAANGVILITTKTGKKGTANIEYNANYVAEKAINSTDYQYVYGQGTGGLKPSSASSAQSTARFAWGAKMDGSQVIGLDGKNYAYSPYKNNIADFYRWGPSFTNTVSVNGGGDKGTYRLSASNLSNTAIVRGSGLDRKTINFSMDQKVTDKLSVTVMANYIDQLAKNPPQLSDGPGNPNNGLFLAPNIKESILSPGYDANGREIVFSDDNYVTNPYFAVNKWINDVSRKRLITAVSAKYNFTSWLYAMSRIGYDNEDDRVLGVTPSGTDYSYNSAGQSGGIGLSTSQTSELNLDALIGVTHKITSDINLDATLGANARTNKSEGLNINGGPFVLPGLYTPGNVLNYGRGYSYNERKVHSGFYSMDFSYKTFFSIGTTGRYDAFSTLYNSGIPKGDRNIFTPSVSASLIFSQLIDVPKLSFGKLRASYAKTSGEPATPYQTAVYYNVGGAINGTSTGSFDGTLPNLFLKPYTLTEFEVGTELKFLSNRLGFDIAYFNRKSSNEIMNANLSWATGYSGSVISNGSIQTKGLEVMVTGNIVKQKNFNWNASFNLTSVSNKVLKTDAAGNQLGLGTYRPLNANTAYVIGLGGPQVMAHDYTYNDKGQIVVDGSGLPVQGGLIAMGSVLPNLYGGFKNDFNYKNFDLSFLIDYNYGNKVLSATKNYALVRGLDKATLVGRETGIKVNGVLADGTANGVTATAESYYQRLAQISRGNVLNGDYIKLRQVTLGYTISEKALAGLPLFSSIQISFVARNLFTFLKNTDNIDPEAGFSSTIRYAGIEGTSLPSTRSFGINANFKFKK
ncbi:SusC/RagA family TonB-linked outer membrane protein [Ferruginibacter paludis]|uniref:SusC/RagA family TonB-linked outer membrane protein n=1 Tax=Ferruginibacter paludis TaxID=1310417 RepID=UPI0025B5A8B1|nr:SusC/RagA family TonB-linked outer membrane protein [Ferruginibacter paludis]MDN3657318.1 SusC/RagA family TonB-linked outer membrane protein [Ferruginibacter paludis]